MKKQRGGTLLGFILGALAGLGVALALAVYITKVPMPFMTKTPSRTADDKKNRDWDPNAALSGKPAAKDTQAVVDTTAAPQTPVATGTPAPSADPVGDLAKAKTKTDTPAKPAAPVATAAAPAAPSSTSSTSAPAASAAAGDPFNYFVQAGAFRTPEDAEQQREQSGRIVYRVRLGPFDKKDDADKVKVRLDTGGLEATLVRVQK